MKNKSLKQKAARVSEFIRAYNIKPTNAQERERERGREGERERRWEAHGRSHH
jgi:hypothetical protein